MEDVFQRFSYNSPMLQGGVWGVLLSEMGLLFFLVNMWLQALLQKHPEMLRGVNVEQVGEMVPNVPMAAGLFLLVVLAVGVFADRLPSDTRR